MQPRPEAGGDADRRRAEQHDAAEHAVRRNREDRLRRDEPGVGHDHAQPVGRRRGDPDQHHRARPNSNASSSTPNNVAATGVPKTALIPAAAPATSRLRRWAAVRGKSWPTTEPTAPPVRMIGPSAPNGPPVPMLIALEIGFKTASRGSTLLPLIRIRSIASGMPWPRICSEPNRAITPTMSPPADRDDDGQRAEGVGVGETRSTLSRW